MLNQNEFNQILTLLHRQTHAMQRIADSLESLERMTREDHESLDTGDTPPSVDLAGRPIGASRGT